MVLQNPDVHDIVASSLAMFANESVPVYSTLADVFGSTEASLPHAKRWNDLAEQFEQRFGSKPAYIARAPGRINLIGEHIDYALFGVLPAAIDRDILIACAPREDHVAAASQSDIGDTSSTPGTVVAENLQSKYPRQDFAPTWKVIKTEERGYTEAWFLDIDTTALRWESYVKAGYYGVLNHFFTDIIRLPVAVNLLITGSVPAGSGLSSSAALVVASTLAFLAVNGKKTSGGLSKGELVQMTMLNEKRVGINSGGMDQAASVMSLSSSALYITFFPSLAASPVPLPRQVLFVVANSLKVANKVVSAKHGYNLRVVETLVAARVLANSLRVSVADKEKITLREVVDRYGDGDNNDEEELDRLLQFLLESDELEVLKSKVIRSENFGVTMDEMIEMSGMSKELFHEVYLSWVDIEATHFQLYKRAKHVFSEARRVLQFRKACLSGSDGSVAEKEVLNTLGQLMNDSQESCSILFECSCPELDDLTRLAMEAGALGSRLTGAGWGGCTISLVPEDKVEGFIRQVRESYEPYKGLDDETFNEVVFATKPGPGACVFEFK